MEFSTVATLAGYKSHYTTDSKRTLCGREVSNGTSGHDMCKACVKAAAKLTEARERLEYATRAAETQDDVMQAAAPVEPTAESFDMANLTDAQITVLETNIGRVPEVIKTAREIGALHTIRSWEHHNTYFLPETLIFRPDVDPAAYSSAVVNANDTAREKGFARLSGEWFDCLDYSYEFMRGENESARWRAAWEEAQQREADAAHFGMLAAHHVIKYAGDARTMCGELVDRHRLAEGILRVSVYPSDATCPECITQEAALAALDDAPEPTDDETRQEALEAALTAAESHMETPLDRAPAPARDTDVWACCESTIGAPCQHRTGARQPGEVMVVVEPLRGNRRKVVAWLVGLNTSLRREFRADRSTPLHVAYWAQTHGVRPVTGKRFSWEQHETLRLAHARV